MISHMWFQGLFGAEYNSNHAQKWGQICWKSVHFSEVTSFKIGTLAMFCR